MEMMWAPWRGDYITGTVDQEIPKSEECVFCEAQKVQADRDRYIIHRGKNAFVILNLYPYNNGHMMIIPNSHICKPEMMDAETRCEVMDLIIKAEVVLDKVYKPHGINIGANIGAAAGAGIAQHMHFHILPRWNADVNFMTAVANTRVIPESLEISWKKIRDTWNEIS